MFVRYRKLENGKVRVQIVENERIGAKVRQKVLRHVATAKDEQEVEHYTKLAEYIKESIEQQRTPKLFDSKQLADLSIESRLKQKEEEVPLMVNLRSLREERRIVTGFHEIYGDLFDNVGYNKVLEGFPVSQKVFRDIVLARLAKPRSKRASCEMLEKDFGIDYALEQIYRMQDCIKSNRKNKSGNEVNIDKISDLQDITWQYTKGLFDQKVKLFFYDCTTLYFESFTEDELRSLGYSKDNKFNQGQVLLALLVTDEGLPVGYDLFPGNMYEGDTFELAINKLKERYKLENIVIIADSGLLSKKNIKFVEASNYKYILGARLKNLPQEWQKKILEDTDYETHIIEKKKEKINEKNETLKVKDYDFDLENQKRLIVSCSSKRAEKDRHDREKAIEKLREKLAKSDNPASLISNYGYKKFLSVQGEVQITVNEEKMAQQALWDGLHGVFTNTDRSELDAMAALAEYHGLWQVEESFRIDKHDLRMRPVFHWTANRILSHIAVCFVAFSLIRFLQHIIRSETKERFSAARISEELWSVQESILVDPKKQKRYVLPSKTSNNTQIIYQAMKKHRSLVPYQLLEN